MLLHFLKHPDASSFNITVLVRSPEKAEKLKAFGVNPVVGSLSDTSLVEELSAQADVVIATVRTSIPFVHLKKKKHITSSKGRFRRSRSSKSNAERLKDTLSEDAHSTNLHQYGTNPTFGILEVPIDPSSSL